MNLDLMTTPSFGAEYEIYDAVGAWDGAPSHFYLQCNRMHRGIYQMGFNPDDESYWIRWLQEGDAGWADWTLMAPQPPPVEPPPPAEPPPEQLQQDEE